ncbi:hypothetical protein [Sphingomonas antarctica]|uniref:hypothetical protein n=1 Tax=Sphingomonas antarctica TaxID=2040274 RepID=UPI0039E84090
MSYYRLYSLSISGKHIIDFDQFTAMGDVAAILKVSCGKPGVARELWSLGRKVMDFAPMVRS